MAAFDTSKIVKDIKAGKIKSKEPPKYIYVKNPRNNTKTKKLNPRWTAWSKKQKGKKIKKEVDKYVENRKGTINRDLTKDYSKKKTEGVGPVKEGGTYAKSLKIKKEKEKNLEKLKKSYKPRADAKVIKDRQKKGKDNLKAKPKPKRFISDPRNKGRKYSVKTAQGKKLANKLKARERAKEMARKRKEKKKS